MRPIATSPTGLIAMAEKNALNRAKVKARETQLGLRQVGEILRRRADDVHDWLEQNTGKRNRRTDGDIAMKQRELAVLTFVIAWAVNQKLDPTPLSIAEICIELDRRTSSVHWWLTKFEHAGKHPESTIEQKQLELAVFVQVRDRLYGRKEASHAA